MKKLIKFLLLVMIIALSYITIKEPDLTAKVQETVGNYIKKEVKEEKEQVTVYYKTAENYVVPLTRTVTKEEAMFDNILNLMTDNEENSKIASKNGLLPTIVAGSIKSVQVDGETAKVSLNKSADEFMDKSDEDSFIYSVIYALTEYKNIDRVMFSLEGKEKLSFGTVMNKPYARENINKIKSTSKSKAKYTMYVAKKCDNVYNYIPYSVYYNKSNLELKEILTEHFRLCCEKKYSSMIFADEANIKDVLIKGESVYVHLTEEFSTMDKVMLNLYKNSVALTIKENSDSIEKVRFIIDQKEENNGIIETEIIKEYSNEEKN